MGTSRIYRAKRIVDVVGATLALILCAPWLVVVGGSLLLWSGESPLFVQKRVGQHERVFRIYKLRTLAFAGKKRYHGGLRRWGITLRKYSIDELPQLWNVIRGDMSLVGPRPLLVEYLPHYNATQRRRHYVRPGITGWAQIHGRNALRWPEKFALDVWYVDHASLQLDFRILLTSCRQALSPQHVRPEGLSEAEKFRG